MSDSIFAFGLPDGLPRLQAGARYGIAYADWLLGLRHYHGKGVPQSFGKAAEHFRRASVGGCILGSRCYAKMLELGQVEYPGVDRALAFYLKAAHGGDFTSQKRVGDAFAYGEWGEQDLKKALHYLNLASINGDLMARAHKAFIEVTGVPLSGSPRAAVMQLDHRCRSDGGKSAYVTALLRMAGYGMDSPDCPGALEYLKLSVQQGHASAERQLGAMLMEGNGIPADQVQAIKLLHSAAKKGDGWAQALLADAMMMGTGTFVDMDAATLWYQRSIQSGYIGAKWHWAYCSSRVESTTLSPYMAAEAMKDALAMGFSKSRETLGILATTALSGAPVDDTIIKYLEHGAVASDVVATFRLADIYFERSQESDDLEKNEAIALFWLQSGVEDGDTSAMCRLGEELITGKHADADIASGVALLNSAASLGHPGAASLLAYYLMVSPKLPRNLSLAAQMNEIAANAGNAMGMHNLALQYRKGEGVGRDEEIAAYWFNKSVECGGGGRKDQGAEEVLGVDGVVGDADWGESAVVLPVRGRGR